MTDTRSEQIKEAKKGNAILFGSNREIRRLSLYLHEGEEVLSILAGSPGKYKGRGIVVATDERVMFIKDGWIFRTVQDYPYETISSVEFKTGILFGTFIMYGKGDETAYNWIGRFAGTDFSKLVRQKSSDAKRGISNSGSVPAVTGSIEQPKPIQLPQTASGLPLPPKPISTPQMGVHDQLVQLKKLYEEGLINIDEFEIKKQEIISRL